MPTSTRPQDLFLSALQKATAETLGLAELINAANALSGAGRADQAQQLYKVWGALNPTHPQLYVAHFNRGCLQTQAGDLAGAIEALTAAITLDPDFMPGYINLGGVLERNGQPDEAIALFIEDYRGLLKQMRQAQRISIEFPVKAGGTRSAVFEVGGLDGSQMPGWDGYVPRPMARQPVPATAVDRGPAAP